MGFYKKDTLRHLMMYLHGHDINVYIKFAKDNNQMINQKKLTTQGRQIMS